MKILIFFELFILIITTTIDLDASADSVCPPNVDVLLPHEDCAKFIECTRGVPMVRACSPGTHFNAKTKACDWPNNAKCTGGSQVKPGTAPQGSQSKPQAGSQVTQSAPQAVSQNTQQKPTVSSQATQPAPQAGSQNSQTGPQITKTGPLIIQPQINQQGLSFEQNDPSPCGHSLLLQILKALRE